MKVLCATLLVLLPSLCVAQCKTATATLKVKIGASEANKQLLVKKLNEHGCDHGLQFELVDDGFDYRILLLDVMKPRMTLTQAGIGSAYESVVSTTVFNDKGSVLFEFGRGNRLTHAGAVNASAKEIVKLLIGGLPHNTQPPEPKRRSVFAAESPRPMCLIVKHASAAHRILVTPANWQYVAGDVPEGMKWKSISDKTIRKIKENGGRVVIVAPNYTQADLKQA